MKGSIRLLVLTHNYPRFQGDHAGVFISLLSRRLTELGVHPIILAPHDRGAIEYEMVDGVTIYRFRYAEKAEDENLAYRGNMQQRVFGSPGGLFKFRHFLNDFSTAAHDIIDREKVQVVAGHWLIPAGIVMKRLAHTRELPMILSSHGTDIRLLNRYGWAVYPYFRGFCRRIHRWTVVSSFLKKQIVRLDQHIKETVEVLPLPHDEDIFYRDENIPREHDLIVSVTRFTSQKRVEYLIKALAAVAKKRPEVKLEIYGSGPRQPEIERLIERLNLSGRVKLSPPVTQPQLRTVYNRAAVVVLNSYQEGFGLALSEAMLCGAAVIGTDSGGIPDIVANEQRGLLVPVDDSTSLSRAILRLLDDDGLRRRLAEAGCRYARETYTSGPPAARYAQIVREALE
ncbi:MAG: glycosyltransferase family 4 protein [bacterium]